MRDSSGQFEDYFAHLNKISLLGRTYKKFVSSPILFWSARQFGKNVIEIGSGTGSGVLGSYPGKVRGLEINPMAVEYCQAKGLKVELIKEGEPFPVGDGEFDVCILDNVLEHIAAPAQTLDECYRITQKNGGLIIAVPGKRGFDSDSDHKQFYDTEALKSLDERWLLKSVFSTPFLFKSEWSSNNVRQYCLVAIYAKVG